MQADTVLQHSRMYGARPRADLAVTRFYTSHGVYKRLAKIHALETALREAFEGGMQDQGVVFIQNDAKGGVIPCAPNKISLSDVVSVKPSGILLPTEFNIVSATKLKQVLPDIENSIPRSCLNSKEFAEIGVDQALSLVDSISGTLIDDSSPGFDWNAMKGLISYLASKVNNRVLILAENGRQLSKAASGDRSGLSILGTAEMRSLVHSGVKDVPAIVLLGQEGGERLGWNSGPFWWPMLVTPAGSKACVFATKVAA